MGRLLEFFGLTHRKPDARALLAASIQRLAGAHESLVAQKRIEFDWFRSQGGLATKHDLQQLEIIMSKLSLALAAFAATNKEYNDRQAVAIDSIVESQNGLTGDIKGLNDLIKKLEESSGEVSEEDQALIDLMLAKGKATAERAEQVAAALKLLDEGTPPVVPVPEPTPGEPEPTPSGENPPA